MSSSLIQMVEKFHPASVKVEDVVIWAVVLPVPPAEVPYPDV